MDERIPMNGIFRPQSAEQWIGIRQDVGLKEVVKTETRVAISHRTRLRCGHDFWSFPKVDAFGIPSVQLAALFTSSLGLPRRAQQFARQARLWWGLQKERARALALRISRALGQSLEFPK